MDFYLAWLASSEYSTFDRFVARVPHEGYRKRLNRVCLGQSIARAGAAIILLHDDGQPCVPCTACVRELECLQCCERSEEIEAARELAVHVSNAADPRRRRAAKRLIRVVRDERGELETMVQDRNNCPVCGGYGFAEMSSGGEVVMKDGRRLAYVDFRRLVNAKKIKVADACLKSACPDCAGNGAVPRAEVRGIFVPRVEIFTGDPLTEAQACASGCDVLRVIHGVKEGADVVLDGETEHPMLETAVADFCQRYSWETEFETIGGLAILKRPMPMPGTLRFPAFKCAGERSSGAA